MQRNADGEPREPSEMKTMSDGYEVHNPKTGHVEVYSTSYGAPVDPQEVEVRALRQQIEALTASLASVTAEKARLERAWEPAKHSLGAAWKERADALTQQLAQVQQEKEQAESLADMRRKTIRRLMDGFKQIAAAIDDDEPTNADHIPSLVSVLLFTLKQAKSTVIELRLENEHRKARAEAAEATALALVAQISFIRDCDTTDTQERARAILVQRVAAAEAVLSDLRERLKTLSAGFRRIGQEPGDGEYYVGREVAYRSAADDLDAILAAPAGESQEPT